MHHWGKVNRQKLQKLINQHLIEVNEQLGYDAEKIDYDVAVGVTSAGIIRKNYPSTNCGEILGRRYQRVR